MTTYDIIENGENWGQLIEAENAESAFEQASKQMTWWDYAQEDSVDTLWVFITVRNTDDEDDSQCGTVPLEPPVPPCEDGKDHDWQSPIEIVGGIESNPGVHGSGGGVTIQEVCLHCGCGKYLDTWATQPDTGEQCLTSTKYNPDYLIESGYAVVDGEFVTA